MHLTFIHHQLPSLEKMHSQMEFLVEKFPIVKDLCMIFNCYKMPVLCGQQEALTSAEDVNAYKRQSSLTHLILLCVLPVLPALHIYSELIWTGG